MVYKQLKFLQEANTTVEVSLKYKHDKIYQKIDNIH